MKIIEPARAIEPAIPILTITRLRPSHPRVSASENDEKPTLAVDEITKTYDTNPRVSDPKASASENDEKPTLATPKVAPQSMTRLHLSEMAETLTPASCIKSVESRMMKGTRIIACNDCRKSKVSTLPHGIIGRS